MISCLTLWPEALIETTRGILKSHLSDGVANGATKAPEALRGRMSVTYFTLMEDGLTRQRG